MYDNKHAKPPDTEKYNFAHFALFCTLHVFSHAFQEYIVFTLFECNHRAFYIHIYY